jgi:hypothetical protein
MPDAESPAMPNRSGQQSDFIKACGKLAKRDNPHFYS